MKRAFVSIFLLVYFTVSTGFTVNMHYCMDRFQSWEFGATESDSCDKCGMSTSESNNCCRDEVKVMKLHQDLFQTAGPSLPHQVVLALPVTPFWYTPPQLHYAYVRGQHYAHSPPLLDKQDTYLSIGVFRI